ncbi:MAG TPA: PrgI family protein [Candidatus Paceibacterota bacterium]|nr:PrgI family protein [Candidatus Paceibacterota bacterium]
MQFQVPQFIDIEDKVIGPLTIKQFLYLLAAGVVLFILYKILNLYAIIILAIPILGITIPLAFIKVHGQPFISIVSNFFRFLRKPDFYVWKKPVGKKPVLEPTEMENIEIVKKVAEKKEQNKPIAKNSLQDIGWRVEVDK